jgi:hypothetical protein
MHHRRRRGMLMHLNARCQFGHACMNPAATCCTARTVGPAGSSRAPRHDGNVLYFFYYSFYYGALKHVTTWWEMNSHKTEFIRVKATAKQLLQT